MWLVDQWFLGSAVDAIICFRCRFICMHGSFGHSVQLIVQCYTFVDAYVHSYTLCGYTLTCQCIASALHWLTLVVNSDSQGVAWFAW